MANPTLTPVPEQTFDELMKELGPPPNSKMGYSLMPKFWHTKDFSNMSDCVKSAATMWYKLTETLGDHYEIWITVSPAVESGIEGEVKVIHHLVYDRVDDVVWDYSCARVMRFKSKDYDKSSSQRQNIEEITKWGKKKILKELKKLGMNKFGKKLEFCPLNVLMLMFCEHHRKMKQFNPDINDPDCDWKADPWKEYYGVICDGNRHLSTKDQVELWNSVVERDQAKFHYDPKVLLPNECLTGEWKLLTDGDADDQGLKVGVTGYKTDTGECYPCECFAPKYHPYRMDVPPFYNALMDVHNKEDYGAMDRMVKILPQLKKTPSDATAVRDEFRRRGVETIRC